MLIIVAGPPGTGKTTLAGKIADHFRLPLLTKDGIKESLFDSLGTSDREWSKKLGVASYRLLFQFIEEILKSPCSLVVESNFQNKYDSGQFRKLIEKYHTDAVQVQCGVEGTVLLERFKARAESGNRHPGHVEHLQYSEIEADLLKGYYEPLDIPGEVISVDTTDFDTIDYAAVLDRVRELMKPSL